VLRRVTLSGGDEVTGVVQQNAPAGSQGPQVVDSPAPAVSVEEIFAPACYPPIDPGI
jgi:hypothetical protein